MFLDKLSAPLVRYLVGNIVTGRRQAFQQDRSNLEQLVQPAAAKEGT
jgi:hypothetical protein